jgi:uncharacterized protein with LGFP repeats
MCCTINRGINQCPPGSFAGGWWKAEGASLCGGHARYYVDCQAECTDCGCHGSAFCDKECWNCRPHCADSGGCDERRVCDAVFRYGQCNQDRHCSGPVLCRAISCTPPWQWANCTTTSATSQATVDHSAPCLPTWSAIGERYRHLGSEGSALGATIHDEKTLAHGRMQQYVHGRMYFSESAGAHYLTGDILHRYLGLGEAESPLGLPITDIRVATDDDGEQVGREARFTRGGIYQGVDGSPVGLWGVIFDKYEHLGLERGELGFPVGALKQSGDGSGESARFANGAIYYRFGQPARALVGTIAAEYRSTGNEDGLLGYPTSEAMLSSDGASEYATFENGLIYRAVGLPPHALIGPVADKYQELGTRTGPLGYPTSDAVGAFDRQGNEGSQVSFASGVIVVTDGVAHAVWGPIYQAWLQQGQGSGNLGFPTSDVYSADSTHDECTFEYGSAVFDHATGAVSISES